MGLFNNFKSEKCWNAVLTEGKKTPSKEKKRRNFAIYKPGAPGWGGSREGLKV